jgi:glycine hydroxymethyltransferase
MTDTFYGSDFGALDAFDPEIAGVLLSELDRLRGGLQLIASENISSPEVLTALGSTLSNKYAEGYPGRRYYGGCSEVDKAESLAIERCKALFGADHANVQPHSGASANQAVYGAFLKPGETILAMSLPHGGHLTHGTKVSFSGKWFNAVHYGVDKDTENIDYDEVERLAKEHRPKVILAGGSAIPRLIDFARFRAIADEVGAIFWVDAAHFIGLVAGKADPQPGPLRRRRVLHDAQGAARPALGSDRLQGRARRRHRQGRLPDDAGRAADAHDRGQGGQLQGVRDPGVRGVRPQVVANAKVLAPTLGEHGIRPTTGGTDTHLSLHDLQPVRDRRRRRGPRGRGRDHVEQERHSLRPAVAEHRLGHPGRHAVRHDPGHG